MKIRNKKRATITSVINAVATDYGLSKLNSLFIQRSNILLYSNLYFCQYGTKKRQIKKERNDLLLQNEASKLLQRAI